MRRRHRAASGGFRVVEYQQPSDVIQDRLDIRSYIDTARKHGCNVMDVLRNAAPAPVSGDQAAELGRLLSLGARQADVGQGVRNWYVLADPEGNEFCLCRP